MKVLIWIVCFFAVGVIVGLFRSQGIILGGLPTVLFYGAACVIARALSKSWDESHPKSDAESNEKDDN